MERRDFVELALEQISECISFQCKMACFFFMIWNRSASELSVYSNYSCNCSNFTLSDPIYRATNGWLPILVQGPGTERCDLDMLRSPLPGITVNGNPAYFA